MAALVRYCYYVPQLLLKIRISVMAGRIDSMYLKNILAKGPHKDKIFLLCEG